MVLPTGSVKCVSVVITSNNFSTLCSFFIYTSGNVLINTITGGRSGGQRSRLRMEGVIGY